MNRSTTTRKVLHIAVLATLAVTLMISGCARYAHDVNALYEPSAGIKGGAGDISIVIPESQQTQSTDIKWVLGDITDDDNRKVDDVTSPRSASEIIQAALALELKRGGYTVIQSVKRRGDEQRVLDLTKAEIKLTQVSGLASLEAKCRISFSVDVYEKGTLLKRLQYEATSSKTDVRDRDLLARTVLESALQSAMVRAVPDLHAIFNH